MEIFFNMDLKPYRLCSFIVKQHFASILLLPSAWRLNTEPEAKNETIYKKRNSFFYLFCGHSRENKSQTTFTIGDYRQLNQCCLDRSLTTTNNIWDLFKCWLRHPAVPVKTTQRHTQRPETAAEFSDWSFFWSTCCADLRKHLQCSNERCISCTCHVFF